MSYVPQLGVKLVRYIDMGPVGLWCTGDDGKPRRFDNDRDARDFAHEMWSRNPKGLYAVEEIPPEGKTTVLELLHRAMPNVRVAVISEGELAMPLKLSDKIFDGREAAHATSGENMQDQRSMVDQLSTWWRSRGQPVVVLVAKRPRDIVLRAR